MGGINYPATNLARNGMQYISLRVSKKTVVEERDSRPTRMITFPSLPSLLLLLSHTPANVRRTLRARWAHRGTVVVWERVYGLTQATMLPTCMYRSLHGSRCRQKMKPRRLLKTLCRFGVGGEPEYYRGCHQQHRTEPFLKDGPQPAPQLAARTPERQRAESLARKTRKLAESTSAEHRTLRQLFFREEPTSPGSSPSSP